VYEFSTTIDLPFDQALTAVRDALAAEQFGIVTDLDVQAVFRARIGKDIPAYRILGACNPALADRVIAAEPNAGALLPCNVVLRAEGPARTVVSFMDPVAVLGLSGAPELKAVAAEAKARLDRALGRLRG
jgi:uncharacterized protein (DUF302 family)